MRTVQLAALSVVALVFALAGAAHAQSVDDVIKLTKEGIGEDVIVTMVQKAEKGFDLKAEDVINLKKAGVSEKVIAAMLKNKAGAPAAPAAPAPGTDVAAPAAEMPPAAAPAAAEGEGQLNLENVDNKAWAYRFDTAAKTLWVQPVQGTGQRLLNAHGGLSLAAPAGTYEVRYAGEGSGSSFTVHANGKTLLLVSRVETIDFEGLYVSVFEKGERKGGGRLAVLRQTRSAPREKEEGSEAKYEYRQPQSTVVDQAPVYVQPQPTVIYRQPTYVYPYYYNCHPYYYYPYNSLNFGYGRYGRRSGWSVGVGIGF